VKPAAGRTPRGDLAVAARVLPRAALEERREECYMVLCCGTGIRLEANRMVYGYDRLSGIDC
jgi:hypothetical protein